MPKTRIQIDYRLTFDAAFHMGTGLRSGLIHRAAAKDPEGFLYVPGSTVKGVVRDRCSQIGVLFGLPPDDPHSGDLSAAHPNVTLIASMFGSQFRAGTLHFDDAALIDEDRKLFEPTYEDPALRKELRDHALAWQTEKRTQVSIWRATGTAESGFLYNSEYGIRGLRFDGRIVGSLPADDQPPNSQPPNSAAGSWALVLLLAGLLSIDRIGGGKSSGAGLVTCSVRRLLVGGKEADAAKVLDWLPALAGHAAAGRGKESGG